MKYALFPVLLILCTGCGTLATSGMEVMPADIDQVASEADSIRIASTSVDNDDQPAGLSAYSKQALVTRVTAQATPSADIPEEVFLDGAYQEANPFSTEPGNRMAHLPAYENQEECVIDCHAGPSWIERSGFLDYMIPVIIDLIDWGGGRLIGSLSGSKAKTSGKSRKSGGRSVRKANRTRSERTPNKGSSRGRGRR